MKASALPLFAIFPLAIVGCEKSQLSFHAPGINVSSVGTHFQASGDLSKLDVSVHPTGPMTTENRTVSDFHSIEVDSSITVQYQIGGQPSIQVAAKKDLLPKIKTEVEDGNLRIGMEDGSYSDTGEITVTITGPELTAIKADGSSKVKVTGASTKDLSAEADGSSEIELLGSIPKIAVDLSGSSTLTALSLDHTVVSGTADGSSQLKLGGSMAHAELELNGASSAHVDGLEAKTCSFKLDGSSTVEAQGKTDELNVEASGASTANLPSLVANNCTAEAEAGSQLHLNAVNELKATASGGAQIGYTGKPSNLVPEMDSGGTVKADN